MPPREKSQRILVVDDRAPMAETLADELSDHGYLSQAVSSSTEALRLVAAEPFDLIVTDLRMPEVDGLAILEASRQSDPARPVIVMTAFGAIDSAVESIRRGAYHYLTKPFKMEELLIFVERALDERGLRREAAALKKTLKDRFSLGGLIGRSAAMQQVFSIVDRIARTDAPVLITGETGVGKGAIARALHAESPRAARPFVTVNCAALPEALLETELFGHLRGAFTGATGDKAGLFVEADGGTLFLDEIAEMAAPLQAKLLQVLESKTVRPVGATKERAVDVRVLAATHRDLRQRVREASFREDLLYRLEVVPIEVPPLRRRREDVPELLAHFLASAKRRHPGSQAQRFSPAAMELLLGYGWPGNVRELSHLVERLVLLAAAEEISAAELPSHLKEAPRSQLGFQGEVLPLRELQRRYVRWAFEELGGHRTRAAERLEIDLKTLGKWLGGDEG